MNLHLPEGVAKEKSQELIQQKMAEQMYVGLAQRLFVQFMEIEYSLGYRRMAKKSNPFGVDNEHGDESPAELDGDFEMNTGLAARAALQASQQFLVSAGVIQPVEECPPD